MDSRIKDSPCSVNTIGQSGGTNTTICTRPLSDINIISEVKLTDDVNVKTNDGFKTNFSATLDDKLKDSDHISQAWLFGVAFPDIVNITFSPDSSKSQGIDMCAWRSEKGPQTSYCWTYIFSVFTKHPISEEGLSTFKRLHSSS